jgi:hypothetical protein
LVALFISPPTFLIAMLPAVELDHDKIRMIDKIEDVVSEWRLAAKMESLLIEDV